MKNVALILFVICSSRVYAMNAKEFFDCFAEHTNEVIEEYITTDDKRSDRVCESFPQSDYDYYINQYSRIENDDIIYDDFSNKSLKELQRIFVNENRGEHPLHCYPRLSKWKGRDNVGVQYNDTLVFSVLAKMIGRQLDLSPGWFGWSTSDVFGYRLSKMQDFDMPISDLQLICNAPY